MTKFASQTMNFQSASGAASRMDAVGCAESERGSNSVKRQSGGFCPEAPKEWHFLRETRQICRDDSGRQLPFSASAERNDTSFAKRVKSTAMIHAGRSPSPHVLKGCCSIRETRQICRDDSCRQESFSANTERNDASFAKRDIFAAMIHAGRSPSPQTQKETTLPSRNASNLPR